MIDWLISLLFTLSFRPGYVVRISYPDGFSWIGIVSAVQFGLIYVISPSCGCHVDGRNQKVKVLLDTKIRNRDKIFDYSKTIQESDF